MTRWSLLWSAVILGWPHSALAATSELDCLLDPKVVVSVASAAEGLIETVNADRGDMVRQHQVLATLESSLERAAVASAKFRTQMEAPLKSNQIRVDYGGRHLDRTEKVYKEGGISIKDVDEAETTKMLAEIGVLEARENIKLAEAELLRATEALNLRTIRSPVPGVVMQRFLYAGEFAHKQAPIFKIAQIDPLHVEAIAPVASLGKIAVGQIGEVRIELPVPAVYTARVSVVDRVIDAASGTIGIRLELPNPGNRISAGLKCKVRFPLR